MQLRNTMRKVIYTTLVILILLALFSKQLKELYLIKGLESSDVSRKCRAIQQLYYSGYCERHFDELLYLLSDSDFKVQWQAIKYIGLCGKNEKVIKSSLECMKKTVDPNALTVVAHSLSFQEKEIVKNRLLEALLTAEGSYEKNIVEVVEIVFETKLDWESGTPRSERKKRIEEIKILLAQK